MIHVYERYLQGSAHLIKMVNPILYTKEKRPDQSMECAVGNFHIRNGATLWRINFGNFF